MVKEHGVEAKFYRGKCVWSWIEDKEFTRFAAMLFGHYQNHFLPFEGGVLDQPFWFNEIITQMSVNKYKIDKEKQDEMQKSFKQQNNSMRST